MGRGAVCQPRGSSALPKQKHGVCGVHTLPDTGTGALGLTQRKGSRSSESQWLGCGQREQTACPSRQLSDEAVGGESQGNRAGALISLRLKSTLPLNLPLHEPPYGLGQFQVDVFDTCTPKHPSCFVM